MRRPAPLAALLAFGLAASAAAAEPPRRLTLAEAVGIAAESSIDVAVANKGFEAADARVSATRGRLLPMLRAEGNIFVWNEGLEVQFAGDEIPEPLRPPPTVIRDQVTGSLSVSLAQPLSSLIPLFSLLEMEKRGRDAAGSEQTKARLDATHRAVEAYLRALQAAAVSDAADKALKQVEAQLERARALERSGVLGRVDVLRLESVLETVRQGALKTNTGVLLSQRGLGLALNLGPAMRFELVDDLPDPPPPVPWTLESALPEALVERPEVALAAHRVEQATLGKRIQMANFFPNIVAIASYQHNEGNGPFLPKDAFFAGATLEWNLFEWGNTWYSMNEAEARIEQARLGQKAAEDMIGFEVERTLLEAKTAFEALAAARAGLAAAEEAQRIQSVRYEQGAATTTDVIDAEVDLARSRATLAAQRYDYYVALATVLRSVGRVAQVQELSSGRAKEKVEK